MNVAAVAAALGASLCYCFAATAQHRVAQHERPAHVLDPRLLLRLGRHPLWIAALVLDLVGSALHGAALTLGPLALVQPLLVTVPILAVPLDAAWDRTRPCRNEIIGVLVAGLGLATFIVVARPHAGAIAPRAAPLLGVAIGIAVFIGILVALAHHETGEARATALGVAAGAGFGVSATLAKAVLDALVTDGVTAILAGWHLWALAIFGVGAVVLNQNAFQAGALAGPLTGIVLTDPLSSIAIAVTAYQERLAGSWVLLGLGLVVMAVGVGLLTHARPRPTR